MLIPQVSWRERQPKVMIALTFGPVNSVGCVLVDVKPTHFIIRQRIEDFPKVSKAWLIRETLQNDFGFFAFSPLRRNRAAKVQIWIRDRSLLAS